MRARARACVARAFRSVCARSAACALEDSRSLPLPYKPRACMHSHSCARMRVGILSLAVNRAHYSPRSLAPRNTCTWRDASHSLTAITALLAAAAEMHSTATTTLRLVPVLLLPGGNPLAASGARRLGPVMTQANATLHRMPGNQQTS